MSPLTKCLGVAGCLLLACTQCPAAEAINIETPQRTKPVVFETEIAPILQANCVACHHAKKPSGGLVLETPQTILKGGESGAAVVAGNSAGSLLLKVASHQQEPVMPPPDNTVGAKPLTPGQLGLLKLWIDQGATGSIAARDIHWQSLPTGYQPALASAVTADGQFAVCSRGNRLLVYHIPTGRLVTTLADLELKGPADSPGAVAHRDLVRSLAFNPAGDLLASGAYREVKLWRRPRVARLAEFPHDASIQTVAITSNGKLAATGDEGGRIRIWDLATGKSLQSIAAQQAAIVALGFSSEGSTMYSVGADKMLRAWNVADGQPIGKSFEAPSPILALALVNKGEWLVTGSEDGVARVWEAKAVRESTEAPKPLQEIKAHGGAVAALIPIAGDGNHFLTGGADGLVRRWDAASGKQLSELRQDAPVIALASSPDGRRIASASANAVALWSDDGKRITQLTEDPVLAAQVSRIDAQVTFTKSAIAMAQQDLKNYEGLIRIAMVRKEDIKKAEEELAKVQKTRDEKKAALEMVKAENGKVEPAEKALADAETAVVVAGTVIDRAKAVSERTSKELADAEQAVMAREELLKQHEAAKQAAAATVKEKPLTIRSLSFSADGQRLIVGTESGVIHAFDAEAGHWSESLADHQGVVRAMATSPDGKLVTVSSDRRALVWSASSQWRLERVIGGPQQPEAFADRVLAVDFNRDGTQLATGGGVPSRSGELKIWNVASGQLVREFKDAHNETIFSVRFSPTSNQVASAAGDRFIKITDTESGQVLQTLPGHTAHVLALSWKADGKMLVSSGADNVLKLWDTEKGVSVKTMKGTTYRIGAYKRDVTAVAFIGDSEQILAASGDGTVRLHRTTSESDILTYTGSKGYQHSVAVTPDGRTAIATGSDGIIRVWSGHEAQPKRTLAP